MRRRDLEPRRHGDPLRRHSAGSGLHLDDDQRAGGDAVLLLRRRGGAPGRAASPSCRAPSRTTSSRNTWRSTPGSIPAEPALKIIVDLFEWAAEHTPQVEHDLHLGLPHPRGRGHGRPGAGVHAGQRLLLRGARPRPRPGRGPLRAAALVLLGRAQRLLRGDRQAACRPPDLGAPHARALRCAGPAELEDAVSLPDGGRHADRAAAAQQYRPGGLPGAGGGARGDPVAAHQRPRRDARAADRGIGADRAPDAADSGVRDRRSQRRRPAGRLATTSRR